MKLLIGAIALAMVLGACKTQNVLSEKYIKTHVESHKTGEFGNLRLYPMIRNSATGSDGKLELVGYTFEQQKGAVLRITKKKTLAMPNAKMPKVPNLQASSEATADSTVRYIMLSEEQCKAIYDNYSVLKSKIKEEKPLKGEIVYHDYTVSKDLFVSFRKTIDQAPTVITFWVDGEKYYVPTKAPNFTVRLKNFLDKK